MKKIFVLIYFLSVVFTGLQLQAAEMFSPQANFSPATIQTTTPAAFNLHVPFYMPGDIVYPVEHGKLLYNWVAPASETIKRLYWGMEWDTGTFSLGDTTDTYDVVHASIVYFQLSDSSLLGTDSFYIAIQNISGGRTMYTPVAVYNLGITYDTTYLSSLLIPGNGVSALYAWYPSQSGTTAQFTGTFYIARLNAGAGGYTNRTRYAFNNE